MEENNVRFLAYRRKRCDDDIQIVHKLKYLPLFVHIKHTKSGRLTLSLLGRNTAKRNLLKPTEMYRAVEKTVQNIRVF